MTEVDSLQSQLREKGKTFNERIENVFMDGLLGQPTTVRIRRWTIRRDQLRKLAEAPHATSGGPAVSLDDTGTSLKADQHVEKAEEKQTKGAKRHGLKNGGEQPRKRHKTPRKYTYHTREDGQPPEMSQIHVDFARLSCAYISANPHQANQKILIDNFNSSPHAKQCYGRVATGTKGTGRADNFFNNGYFKMADLRQIAVGMEKMPVPLLLAQDMREYSRYEANGDAGDNTAAAAAGGGGGDATAVGEGGRDEGGTDVAGGAAACPPAEAAARGGAAETAVQTPKKAAGVAGGRKRRPKGSRSTFSPSDSSPSEGTDDDGSGGDSAAAPGTPAAAAAAGRRRALSTTAAAPAGVPSDGRRSPDAAAAAAAGNAHGKKSRNKTNIYIPIVL